MRAVPFGLGAVSGFRILIIPLSGEPGQGAQWLSRLTFCMKSPKNSISGGFGGVCTPHTPGSQTHLPFSSNPAQQIARWVLLSRVMARQAPRCGRLLPAGHRGVHHRPQVQVQPHDRSAAHHHRQPPGVAAAVFERCAGPQGSASFPSPFFWAGEGY